MSSIEEIYRIVGQINYSLVRITFNVSDHLYKIGLEGDTGSFFADPNTDSKFNKLPSRFSELPLSSNLKSELKDWIRNLVEFVKKRNTVTHSLVLYSMDNPEEFRFYNYRKNKGKVSMEITEVSIAELKVLNERLIELHNEGFQILLKIEKSLPLVSVLRVQNPYASFKEIDSWLKDEDKESNTGFYSQIEIIKHRFHTQKSYLAYVGGEIVGFATYSVFENIATIEIFEIKPDKRHKGYGNSFVRKLILIFKKEGCSAIVLRSIDKLSDSFWRKLGFNDISGLKIRGPGFTHYLPFANGGESAMVKGQKQISIIVEILDMISINASHENPVFRWTLDTSHPEVVQPVDFEWTIRVYEDNKEIYCNLIKRLDHEKCRVLFGSILVITDIKNVLKHIRRTT